MDKGSEFSNYAIAIGNEAPHLINLHKDDSLPDRSTPTFGSILSYCSSVSNL